jgi:hypothetical protein
MKLLKYLELDFIVQPVGCRKCNFTGIVSKGIQVVSEHLFLSSEDKDNLLKLNIHDQSKYLQKRVNDMDSLERTVMEKLLNGDILLNEAVVKLQI